MKKLESNLIFKIKYLSLNLFNLKLQKYNHFLDGTDKYDMYQIVKFLFHVYLEKIVPSTFMSFVNDSELKLGFRVLVSRNLFSSNSTVEGSISTSSFFLKKNI